MEPLVTQMEEEPLGDGEDASIEEEQKRRREVMLAQLDVFGQSLAKTRAEAIAARQSSGIEDVWLEDEEFYQGIDNANRGEQHMTFRQKPPGQKAIRAETTRSTVFPNITGPYVDAAAARIADMLLPTDDRPWAIKPPPVPEIEGLTKKKFPPQMLRDAAQMYPGQPQLAQKRLSQAVDEAIQIMAVARERADKAEKRIDDWHVECQWHAQVRLVIEDSARIGTGVLKGPVPTKKRAVRLSEGGLMVSQEIKPGSRRIDAWNVYPDPACGENIHNGAYVWERDYLTRQQLRDMKGLPGYIEEQIDLCLAEGPGRATAEYKQPIDIATDPEEKGRFEVWYFHGVAERENIEAAGCDCGEVTDPHVSAMVVMVNNRVVNATLNPLDTAEFPYDVMVWRQRSGFWAGIGVSRQIRTPQRIVTAATRNLMDNAGIAAGPMLVFRQGVVSPANGVAEVAPRKMWYIAPDAESMEDATRAVGVIKIDMLVAELLQIINLGMRLAEDVTGLPMLMQGQQGQAPDTVGGMQLLNNNANSVLRRLARLFDDRVTEPHVRRYYHWLLQYGEDDEKGDCCIDARGSSALVERDIQNQELVQMGQMALNPAFGVDPRKWAQEYLKSRHFDPKRFEYDDEKWQQIIEHMSKGPSDPRLEIEQMRLQSADQQRKLDATLAMLEHKIDAEEGDKDRRMELLLFTLDQDMERMRQSGEKGMSFDKIKAMLADTAMRLRTQRELSYANMRTRQVMKPPTEPVGRARAGRAFQA